MAAAPRLFRVFLFTLLALSPGTALALSGESIAYSGRITEADGKPVDGPVDLEIRFFDAVAGGTQLGSGALSFPATPLAQGVFHVDLTMTGAEWQTILGSVYAPAWVEV